MKSTIYYGGLFIGSLVIMIGIFIGFYLPDSTTMSEATGIGSLFGCLGMSIIAGCIVELDDMGEI